MSAHRLPPELLVVMLELCHNMEPFRFPWLASEVCSHWRQVILNTPTLWTDIHLEFYSTNLTMTSRALARRTNTAKALGAYNANQVDLARHQLARSRDLPLSVSLFTRVYSGSYNLIHDAINLIFVQNAHRIQKLRVSDTCVGLMALATAIQQQPLPMPLLRRLDVWAYTLDRSPAELDLLPYHAFRLATNLVSAAFASFIPPPLDLCWSHLTDLTVSCIETQDVYKVLPHLTNLIDLKLFSCFMAAHLPPSDMTFIVLPSLLHLWIDCVPTALYTITTPNLETLSLMMWDDEEVTPVIAFLHRSRCAVHTLELAYLRISLEATTLLLTRMPYVKKLDWKGGNEHEAPVPTVVQALALRDNDGRFECCPRLSQLILDLPATHPRHFIDMIERRWRTKPQDDECDPLREVELVFNEAFWTEDRGGCEEIFGRKIERLMEEGMLVDVKYIGQEGEAWDFFQEIFA